MVKTQLQVGYTVAPSGACFTSPFFLLVACLNPEKSHLAKKTDSNTKVTGLSVVRENRVKGCEALGYDIATGSPENDFRYVGEQADPNSGFYYLRARWMDPSVGRFVGVDPYEGDPQAPISLHRYLYANGNPIGIRDPSGKFGLAEVTGAIGIFSILSNLSFVRPLQLFGSLWQVKPNNDGKITFAEANWQWKHGNGQPLNADLSLINFYSISLEDFEGDTHKTFNLLGKYFIGSLDDALVYGQLDLKLIGDGLIQSVEGYDDFDFDKKDIPGQELRNKLTQLGHIIVGVGEAFRINFYGFGYISD